VVALLARICREDGVAVLLVAHDVNPLLDHLDRVVYLAAGRALSGPAADVVNGEQLSALYGMPIEVLRTRDGRLVVVGVGPRARRARAARVPVHGPRAGGGDDRRRARGRRRLVHGAAA